MAVSGTLGKRRIRAHGRAASRIAIRALKNGQVRAVCRGGSGSTNLSNRILRQCARRIRMKDGGIRMRDEG
jgi:hypothetical protein